MSKLTELPAVTTPAQQADVLYAVRPADGTAGSQKITVGDLGIPVKLATVTDPGGTTFSFTSLPSGFSRFIIKGHMKSDFAAVQDVILLHYNTVTSGYKRNQIVYLEGGGGAPSSSNDATATVMAVPAATGGFTDGICAFEIIVEQPSSLFAKAARSSYTYPQGNGALVIGFEAQTNQTLTAVITQIDLVSSGGGTLTGTVELYGQ